MFKEKYQQQQDNLKLIGRGYIPFGLGVFFLCLFSLFIGLILYTTRQELFQFDWQSLETLLPLFLVTVLGIPTFMLGRGLLPLQWNAQNGLEYRPIKESWVSLLAGVFWSVISIACCLGFFLAEPVSGEELPRHLFFAIMGLIAAYGGIYFLYRFLKRWQQYRRFGDSQLEIVAGVPRIGATIKVRLIEDELVQGAEPIQVRFANIQERFVKKRRKKQAVRVERQRLYEHQEEVSAEDLTRDGIELEIPISGVSPTHYDRCQPDYWELELSKEDSKYQARFLLYVQA
ncbi:MAG: hypothetical protein AAFQ68_08700 [Bacteroidota bacterium]